MGRGSWTRQAFRIGKERAEYEENANVKWNEIQRVHGETEKPSAETQ